MKKCKEYQNEIVQLKESIVKDLNQYIKNLEIEGLEYVELPKRIRITNQMGVELDDYIIAIRKDEAIINTLFADSTPKLVTLDTEILIKILQQMEEYTD